jgi:hypothetical protein
MSSEQIYVTSHVGRDVLQSSSLFKDEAAVVWEYISNSLQYVDSGIKPRVSVEVQARKKVITISDNGRGMDRVDLQRFFTMHGENLDRTEGKLGRGRFGTGKSACFAIAKSLIVDSVKNGKRNVVRLDRDDLEKSEEQIPVDELVMDEPSEDENGTKVTLEGVFGKVKVQRVVEYTERHLQAFRSLSPEVLIDDIICEYNEPDFSEEFEFTADAETHGLLQGVCLSIKVSQAPLKPEQRGIAISAGEGNMVAIETGGVDSKDMGEFLFGAIDVPSIESFESEIDAFDSSRSMQLKMGHPVVNQLIPFIGTHLERVRKTLVARKKEEKKSEQEKRLQEEAEKLSDVLNEDLKQFMDRLQGIKVASTKRKVSQLALQPNSEEGSTYVEGMQERGSLNEITPNDETNPSAEPQPNDPPDVPNSGNPDEEGSAAVDPASTNNKSSKRKPQGGFRIEFDHHGVDKPRSKYVQDKGIIYINLDHPVVEAAHEIGPDDPSFRRLAYEIAFTEYAFAVAANIITADPDIPADEIHYEISSTLYRISTNAAALYR